MHALTALCSRAAWKSIGDMPASEAKRQYAALVSSLCPTWDQHGSSRAGGLGGPVFSSLAHADGDDGGNVRIFCQTSSCAFSLQLC